MLALSPQLAFIVQKPPKAPASTRVQLVSHQEANHIEEDGTVVLATLVWLTAKETIALSEAEAQLALSFDIRIFAWHQTLD